MRARRVDGNLADIVSIARQAGFLVNVRNDALADLDVQLRGRHELWEIKDPTKPPSKRGLTPLQVELRAEGWSIRTVMTAADVLAARKEMLAPCRRGGRGCFVLFKSTKGAL